MTYASFVGKRTRILLGWRCQCSHYTTLIKSFSVIYLIKMASSNCSLVSLLLICSLLRERVGCLHYFVLESSFLLDASRCGCGWWIVLFRHVFTGVDPMVNEKGRFNQQLTSCTLQVGKKRCIALPFGVDVSCTHSHLVLWNDIFSNKQTFFFFCILPLQLPPTTY